MTGCLVKVAVLAGISLAAGAAHAREEEKPRAKLLQQAVDCAAIAADAQRLACYDRTVAALGKAEEAKEIIVTDREQMRQARRSLFGFQLPSLKIFGGGDDEELNKIETTISSVSRTYDGSLSLTVADGARWTQTDSRAIVGRIKPGDKVTISRGAMGSYFASIPGRPAFKVQRRQ